jgi:MOZ/SAS family/MYST family zinc finger domain
LGRCIIVPSQLTVIETLYVCDYCLTYMRKRSSYTHHCQTCIHGTQPGTFTEIYPANDVSVYELDGKEQKLYCQKLCLLAKLEEKTGSPEKPLSDLGKVSYEYRSYWTHILMNISSDHENAVTKNLSITDIFNPTGIRAEV